MDTKLRQRLSLAHERLDELNALILDPGNEIVNRLLEIVESYGGPEEINRKAREAGRVENLLARLEEEKSPYLADLRWLIEQRDAKAFVSIGDFCASIGVDKSQVNWENAVTLEVSSLQFFPWLITEAKQAIERKELMPGRYIRVRNMKEQSTADNGDTLAMSAALRIIGASHVETLDTKGTDGSNVHLGGPETITGYFGGVGEPNDYPLKWIDECLYYYTNYGIRQVLNVNSGTILAAYLLHKLGVDNEFKISVFMGNDNPFAILWTLMAARLFSRADGTTSLIGFNFSNSVNNETIRLASDLRRSLGLESVVRFEHHITETYKSIVRQPYNRRDELLDIARTVPNISAKHEGGEPEIEQTLSHPSDILDYFIPKADVLANGLWPHMERNYLEKHASAVKTGRELLKRGIGVVCAKHLH